MLHDPNQNTLFPKLSDEALQEMKQHGTEIQLAAGEVLFSEGDSDYNFHVVLEGEIQITKQVGGETRLLTIHRRGDFMGELSMLTGSSSAASGQAIAPSRVLRIDRVTFKHIIAECSPIADILLTAMAGRTKDIAIDAMNGHGKIWIRTSRENNCVLVEIADNGSGIPPEIQSHQGRTGCGKLSPFRAQR